MRVAKAVEVLNKNRIDVILHGDPNISFHLFVPLGEDAKGKAVFVHERGSKESVQKRHELLKEVPPTVLITTKAFWKNRLYLDREIEATLLVDDPRLAFSFIAENIMFENMTYGKDCQFDDWEGLGAVGLSNNRHGDKQINTFHAGGLKIGKGVRSGHNVVIQKAIVGLTEIGDYVFIAHNSVIGHGC